MQWHLVLAAASTSGDLGYTTGPWSFKDDPAAQEATDHGQFVSIWRWEDGRWKLRFDLGSDNPAPSGPRAELQSGYYLHIWRNRAGEWKLALNLMHPRRQRALLSRARGRARNQVAHPQGSAAAFR